MENLDFTVEELGGSIVLDEKSQEIRLSSLWKERTAVLIFVRHFG